MRTLEALGLTAAGGVHFAQQSSQVGAAVAGKSAVIHDLEQLGRVEKFVVQDMNIVVEGDDLHKELAVFSILVLVGKLGQQVLGAFRHVRGVACHRAARIDPHGDAAGPETIVEDSIGCVLEKADAVVEIGLAVCKSRHSNVPFFYRSVEFVTGGNALCEKLSGGALGRMVKSV